MATGNIHKNWQSSVTLFSSYARGQTDIPMPTHCNTLHPSQGQINNNNNIIKFNYVFLNIQFKCMGTLFLKMAHLEIIWEGLSSRSILSPPISTTGKCIHSILCCSKLCLICIKLLINVPDLLRDI